MITLVETSGLSNSTLGFIVTIAFALMALLVGVIAFFLKRELSRQDEKNKNMETSVNKFSDSVTSFNGVVLQWQERQAFFEKRYDDHLRQLHNKEA